jgi:hypothetical protein
VGITFEFLKATFKIARMAKMYTLIHPVGASLQHKNQRDVHLAFRWTKVEGAEDRMLIITIIAPGSTKEVEFTGYELQQMETVIAMLNEINKPFNMQSNYEFSSGQVIRLTLENGQTVYGTVTDRTKDTIFIQWRHFPVGELEERPRAAFEKLEIA